MTAPERSSFPSALRASRRLRARLRWSRSFRDRTVHRLGVAAARLREARGDEVADGRPPGTFSACSQENGDVLRSS